MIKKQIPNCVTLMNLLCGCISIYFATTGNLLYAGIFIFLGGIFDFFDGFVARLLKVQGELGVQLDSLADVVTFGVAPGFIAHRMLLLSDVNLIISFIPFLMILFSAYRLAKFNIDTRQTTSFIGLPTPANALIWASFPFFTEILNGNFPWKFFCDGFYEGLISIVFNPYVIIILAIVLSILLVAEIPLFALKFKNIKDKENLPKWIFLGTSVILFILLSIASFPFIIVLYIILSLIFNRKNHEIHSRS